MNGKWIFRRQCRAYRGRHKATRTLQLERLEDRTLPSNGLVAAYALDEASGATVLDASGNGHNGLLSNAIWAQGVHGGGLTFTGDANSYVSIPYSPSFDLTTAFTLEAWVNPSTLNSPDDDWCAVLAKDHPTSSAEDVSYALYAAAGTSTPPSTHILTNRGDVGVSAGAALNLNTWTHLAASYDGAFLKIYLNGVLAQVSPQIESIVETSAPFKIGGDWDGEMFTGTIDDVRVYDVALTQAQIAHDMLTPVGGLQLTAGLPAATVNSAYTATVGANGGSGSYAYAVTSGALPSWLTLDPRTGVLTGTPPVAGTTAFTVTAIDRSGSGLIGSQVYSLTVNGPSSPVSLAISLVGGNTVEAGFPFVFTVQAVDQSGNPVSNYSGPDTVTISSSSADPYGDFPIAGTLNSSGFGVFLGKLGTAGSYMLTAASGSFSGTSIPLSTLPAAAAYFKVDVPSSASTGSPLPVTVTALDSFGNVATGYHGIVHFTSSDGAASLPSDAALVGGTGVFSATFNTAGEETITATDAVSSNPTITGTSRAIVTGGLKVMSFVPTPTGFTVTFSKPFVPASLALYGKSSSAVQDVTLRGSKSEPISGSLVVDPSNTSLTFKATTNLLLFNNDNASAVLPDDTYTVTLISGSGSEGLTDALGTGLHDDSGHTSSYVTTFTTHYLSSATPVLAIPDFARGPDAAHVIKVPNDIGQGIPITLYNAVAVSDLTVSLDYDPSLLNVLGAVGGTNSDAASSTSSLTMEGQPLVIDATHATATFHFSDSKAGFGTLVLGDIQATVPATAAAKYKAQELLQLHDVEINGAAAPNLATVNGIHVNAYFGDVSGDVRINGLDLATTNTVAQGEASGFTAFPLLDPTIVGDVANDISVDAGDVSTIAAVVARLPRPVVPSLPDDGVVIGRTPAPLPAPTGTVINVATVNDLQSAVANLQSGQTIVIAPGTYHLTAGLSIGLTSHLTNVAIRGATNNSDDVVLLGAGMNDSAVAMGISVWNAQNVTIANLSISQTYDDAIELKGDQGADRITIYNCHLFDTGEQIIKSDPNTTGGGVTNSSVQYCTLGYTTAPPTVDHGGGTGYTNGVDVHGGSNWLVSNNVFQNFHTPDNSANLWNPVVLFWNHSANNSVIGNSFTNCDRAIDFGLNELSSGFDNQGGLIANNFVYMAPGEYSASRQAGADAPIIAWDSPDTTIAFNTILTNGNTPNSVQVRFVETTNVTIQGNLSDEPLRARDSATYTAASNFTSATSSMFVNAAGGDLHLVSTSATQASILGKAAAMASVATDYDGQARANPTDVGADQYSSSINGPSPTLTLNPTTLPGGTVNTDYRTTLSSSGGSGTYSYAVTTGSLPPGLTLNASSGVLSGTPTTSGSSWFVVTATDSANADVQGSRVYTFTVNPGGSLTITPQATVYPVNLTYGTALANSQLTGTATATVNGEQVTVAGSFAYTSASGTVLTAGSGQSKQVTFTPTDTTNYTATTTTVTINVARATPQVTVNPVTITQGTALANSQLTGTATATVNGQQLTVAGTFSYTSAGDTVPSVGSGLVQPVAFTPSDTSNYTDVAATVTVNVTAAADTTPPTVAIITPFADASLSGIVTLVAAASDNVGVIGVQFFLDGVALGAQDSTSPYTFSWDTTTASNGSHTLSAKASDAAGNITTSSPVQVTVNNSSGGPGSGSTGEPLLYSSNLQYVGAFRVPNGQFGSDQYDAFSYGGTALAYNPTNNSLFMVGHVYDQAIAEVSIPSAIVNSNNISNLSTATLLQPFMSPLPKVTSNPTSDPPNRIGGLAVVNGKLVGTGYVFYDATDAAISSHFVLNSLNLATATVSGLYEVGGQGAGLVAGYMTPIPSEWQSLLGAPYLTGQANIPIISRTSSGPAAFGFDPSSLGSGVASAIPYVYYPISNPLGPYEGPADPVENASSSTTGVVFVPGTSSVLFFGATAASFEGYGVGTDWGDAGNISKGPVALNGEYALQVWAYNANDFVKVKNGTLQPWQVQPYDVWNFTLPNTSGSTELGGVAFDPASGRLYMSITNADNVSGSSLPLIEVFQVTTDASTGPPSSEIGTLSGAPSVTAQPNTANFDHPLYDGTYAGPVQQGDPVVLTAGNVYGTNITQVAFYVVAGRTSSLIPAAAVQTGYGKPSTIANASHNWVLTLSTASLAPGFYTVFAQAMDTNGLSSDPISWTLEVR